VALLTLDGEGTLEKWTYRELHDLSARLAGVLKDLGVGPGDRVALYLPTGVEAGHRHAGRRPPRGGPHGPAHGPGPRGPAPAAPKGRSPPPHRRRRVLPEGPVRAHPAAVEAALSGLDLPVLWHRRGTTEFLERAMEGKPQEALPVPSSHPLFPPPHLGLHGHAQRGGPRPRGYMVGVAWALHHLFDLKPGEVFHTTADLFWIVGHSFGLYAPLFLGGRASSWRTGPITRAQPPSTSA
jgi:acetyl-CoA synthetase